MRLHRYPLAQTSQNDTTVRDIADSGAVHRINHNVPAIIKADLRGIDRIVAAINTTDYSRLVQVKVQGIVLESSLHASRITFKFSISQIYSTIKAAASLFIICLPASRVKDEP